LSIVLCLGGLLDQPALLALGERVLGQLGLLAELSDGRKVGRAQHLPVCIRAADHAKRN